MCTSERVHAGTKRNGDLIFMSSCISMNFRPMGPCMDDSTTRPESTWSNMDSKGLPDEQQVTTPFSSFRFVTEVFPVLPSGAFTQRRKGPECSCEQCDRIYCLVVPRNERWAKIVRNPNEVVNMQSPRGPGAPNQHETMDQVPFSTVSSESRREQNQNQRRSTAQPTATTPQQPRQQTDSNPISLPVTETIVTTATTRVHLPMLCSTQPLLCCRQMHCIVCSFTVVYKQSHTPTVIVLAQRLLHVGSIRPRGLIGMMKRLYRRAAFVPATARDRYEWNPNDVVF